jgi:hypothetical protein
VVVVACGVGGDVGAVMVVMAVVGGAVWIGFGVWWRSGAFGWGMVCVVWGRRRQKRWGARGGGRKGGEGGGDAC